MEDQELALLKEKQVDLVVLARYMQIITDTFCDAFPHRVINIHHSFLPAFIGSKPYHRAHARGVKVLIGGLDLMIRRLTPENIDIQIDRASKLSPVLADAGQLEQVIVNLTVNARDAMVEGGRLTILTQEADVSETFAKANPWARPGHHVMLQITDSGARMS